MREVSKLLLSLKPGQAVYRTRAKEKYAADLSLNSMTDQTNPFVINPVALLSWTHPFKEHDPMIYYGMGKAMERQVNYDAERDVIEKSIFKNFENTFVFLHYFDNATYQFTFSKFSIYAEIFHTLFYIL